LNGTHGTWKEIDAMDIGGALLSVEDGLFAAAGVLESIPEDLSCPDPIRLLSFLASGLKRDARVLGSLRVRLCRECTARPAVFHLYVGSNCEKPSQGLQEAREAPGDAEGARNRASGEGQRLEPSGGGEQPRRRSRARSGNGKGEDNGEPFR